MRQYIPIPGHPDYGITDHGQVARLTANCGTRPGHLLKPWRNKESDYLQVGLTTQSKTKTFNLHELVARTFHGPRPAGFDVNHKNCIRVDNHFRNLEYVSRKDNVRHAVARNRMGAGMTLEKAAKIRSLKRKLTQTEIAKQFGVSQPTICKILRNEAWVA